MDCTHNRPGKDLYYKRWLALKPNAKEVLAGMIARRAGVHKLSDYEINTVWKDVQPLLKSSIPVQTVTFIGGIFRDETVLNRSNLRLVLRDLVNYAPKNEEYVPLITREVFDPKMIRRK